MFIELFRFDQMYLVQVRHHCDSVRSHIDESGTASCLFLDFVLMSVRTILQVLQDLAIVID
jgi:hypothetical protein